jgi:hypothetical protein
LWNVFVLEKLENGITENRRDSKKTGEKVFPENSKKPIELICAKLTQSGITAENGS